MQIGVQLPARARMRARVCTGMLRVCRLCADRYMHILQLWSLQLARSARKLESSAFQSGAPAGGRRAGVTGSPGLWEPCSARELRTSALAAEGQRCARIVFLVWPFLFFHASKKLAFS